MSWADKLFQPKAGADEEEDSPPPRQPFSSKTAAAPVTPLYSPQVSIPLTTIVPDEEVVQNVYKTLCEATAPSNVPVLAKIYGFIEPLKAVISDPSLRLRAALASSHATPLEAKAGIETLSKLLDAENKRFLDRRADAQSTTVTANKAKAAELQKQIDSLQSQLSAIQSDIANNEKELASMTAAFNSALNRRAQELAAMATDFTS
jgi:hypothetical protein